MPNIIKILSENARKAKERERLANMPPQTPAQANRYLLENAVLGSSYEIKTALKAGADINTTDGNGDNALTLAASDFVITGAEANFGCLIKNGINVNHQNKKGETALMVLTRYFEALEKSDKSYFKSAFRTLVKGKADFSIPDKNNKDVFDELCAKFFPDDASVIEYCLKKAYKYASTPAQRAYVYKKKYKFEYMLSEHKEKSAAINQTALNKKLSDKGR